MRIALDNFVYSPRAEPLLPLADYVKLNVRQLGAAGLGEQLEQLRGRVRNTVACRIETQQDFNACLALGCRFFQGNFLFRPQLLSHTRLPKSLETLARLLERLRDPAVEFGEIERIVKTDPALSAAVPRFLGSAAHARRHQITSISQTVSMLGLREFSRWVTVVALTATTDRPSELSFVALIRARAAEIVAAEVGADPEAAFLVGLVSALDALFERPLDRVLAELPLASEVQAAVLQQSGVLGHILVDVLSHESDEARQITRFETGMVNRAWLDALIWAGDALDALR